MTAELRRKLKLKRLQNGMFIPTEEMIIETHKMIIEYRNENFGKTDRPAIRDRGILTHLCDSLSDRMHKYKSTIVEDSLYVASEAFFYIACQHPFHDGNKSTAYIMALSLYYSNIILNTGIRNPEEKMLLEITKHVLSAPDEAKEITKLAEGGGKSDVEIKRLIKRFLSKQLLAENVMVGDDKWIGEQKKAP
ncbi:MAG: Fic family protein [Candidatus Micrarchaeota archaeon]